MSESDEPSETHEYHLAWTELKIDYDPEARCLIDVWVPKEQTFTNPQDFFRAYHDKLGAMYRITAADWRVCTPWVNVKDMVSIRMERDLANA